MGQEIKSSRFSPADFNSFALALEKETALLRQYFDRQLFSNEGGIGGFEVEAWLVNAYSGRPEPINQRLLDRINNPLVVSELAAFNVELNNPPEILAGTALSRMERSLADTWSRCREVATQDNADIMMVGILPSVREDELTLANMTQLNRYWALNEQVFQMRNELPIVLDIHGREHLRTTHYDVMLEAATTSFQIHLQIPLESAVRFYNIAKMISAPMVAATANSPYLFGRDLWHETRVPLFEQSVDVGDLAHRRVTFGDSYARQSLIECFEHNITEYPILVPSRFDTESGRLEHLRFHNGTIWRWNRPLIGFDENNIPHLRIEHRVVPSGPSIVDSIANAACFFGLMYALVDNADDLTQALDFATAKDNFYACAREGLESILYWPGYGNVNVRELLLDHLIPAAGTGLRSLGIDGKEAEKYLSIMKQRIERRMNGATWQRTWVQRHGRDMQALTLAYLERQNSGEPVCDWTV